MTTLGIHYLTGCAVATDRTQSRPEFPPHFGRVFMALTATYFETRGSDDERAVLEWLEQADPPSIKAGKGNPRRVRGLSRYEAVTTYVPVNDEEPPSPLSRTRQSRSFPTMRLDDPFVYLTWDADVPDHLRGPLERLCGKVTRIGHSSSLVQMWVAAEPVGTGEEWRPDDGISGIRMRIAERGTLKYLERSFNETAITNYYKEQQRLESVAATAKGKEKSEAKAQLKQLLKEQAPASARPTLTRWASYTQATDRDEQSEMPHGPFDPNLIVLTRAEESSKEEGGPNGKKKEPLLNRLGLEATLQLTSALRNAAMKAAGENPPEWLTGHQADGKPSLKPHAAFFPLPYVGADYADGHVMGLAMALPREIDTPGETTEAALRRVLGPLLFDMNSGAERTIRLWRNKSGENGPETVWEWRLKRETRDYPELNLRARTWTRPSAEWASVTPVVLHHYPKRGREGDVERIVLEAFKSADLPRPLELRVQPVSVLSGVGHVKSMPDFTEGGERLCRYQVHLWVRFPSKVEGPLLVGRGRFRGYGLLRPVSPFAEVRHG